MKRVRSNGIRFATVLLAVAACAISAGEARAATDVVIDTQLLSGNPLVAGSRLRVQVNIKQVITTNEPSGVAFKVLFPTSSVTWGWDPTPTPGDEVTVEEWPDPDGVGPLSPWSASESSADVAEGGGIFSRRISTFGGPIPTGTVTPATPWGCFIVNFTVAGPSPAVPYNIEIADDPLSSAPVAAIVLTPIPAVLSLTPQYLRTGTTILAPAVAGVSSSSLTFPSTVVSSTSDLTFDVTNTGGTSMNVTALNFGATGFSVVAPTPSLPFAVAPGSPVTVTVRFSPVAATSYSDTLTVDTDAATDPTVSLSGTGDSSIGNWSILND